MTGFWTGEPPEEQAPAMPLASMVLANKERGPGDNLAIAAARSRAGEARAARDEAAGRRDPDEIAAAMINRGLAPGLISDLGQRLADVEGELAGEQEKIEKGERVTARVRGMLERGQIGGLDAARMLDSVTGDARRAAQLERRAGRLRQQLADAQAMIAPPQERELDAVAEAGRRAHAIFRELTRAKVAELGTRPPGAARPFASPSRGGFAARSEPVTCPECLKCGFTPEQSFEVHHTDADGRLTAAGPEVTEPASGQEAGRGESWPLRYDASGREITRAAGYDDDGVYGNHPVVYR